MAPRYATTDRVGLDELLAFVRPRHRVTLITTRRDGRPQVSPVTAGVDDEGRIVVSTYPSRAKAGNLRRDPAVSLLVHSDDWDGPYVQVDGTAEVLDLPEALEPLVDYFREHLRRAPRLGRVPAGDARPGQVTDPGHHRALGPGRDGRVPARPGRRRQLTVSAGDPRGLGCCGGWVRMGGWRIPQGLSEILRASQSVLTSNDIWHFQRHTCP